MSYRVVGLGAGGHAKGIIEILKLNPSYQIVGLLDPKKELHGLDVLGVPVLGGDELLLELIQENVSHFFIGLGGVGDNKPRQKLFEFAVSSGIIPVDVIHPKAIISPLAKMGQGVQVMAGAVVNVHAQLGADVILNSNSVVEHDCAVGDHVHIATGAVLASTVTIGESAHVGAGAIIRQSITIGKNAIIGAGAVVVNDIPANTIVVGNPAKPLKSNSTQNINASGGDC